MLLCRCLADASGSRQGDLIDAEEGDVDPGGGRRPRARADERRRRQGIAVDWQTARSPIPCRRRGNWEPIAPGVRSSAAPTGDRPSSRMWTGIDSRRRSSARRWRRCSMRRPSAAPFIAWYWSRRRARSATCGRRWGRRRGRSSTPRLDKDLTHVALQELPDHLAERRGAVGLARAEALRDQIDFR